MGGEHVWLSMHDQHVIVFAEEEEGDDDVDTEEEEQDVITVVYFWQGRQATNMGWLHFTHGLVPAIAQALHSWVSSCN